MNPVANTVITPRPTITAPSFVPATKEFNDRMFEKLVMSVIKDMDPFQ